MQSKREGKPTEETLRLSEERFRLMIESVRDYAIFLLDPNGCVTSWNPGAERIKGYTAEEIVGRHFSLFYPPEAVRRGHPQYELEVAVREGRYEEEALRLRKDGSAFWANVVISAVRDADGKLVGFAKVTRDFTERREAQAELERFASELEERVRQRTADLQAANQEMEAFSYSVSHDLRAPLRACDGFSKMVLESAAAKLDEQERDYLERVRAAAQRMAHLIDDLLTLSRLSRTPLSAGPVDLSALAEAALRSLREAEPTRRVESLVEPGMRARGDANLLHVALESLIANAWKFTRPKPDARIEVGATAREGKVVYHVRDNGVGFDMRYAGKLFMPFQRLHGVREFEGTGIGLATVRRIIRRHGGDIWAESQPGRGSTFSFTLGELAV